MIKMNTYYNESPSIDLLMPKTKNQDINAKAKSGCVSCGLDIISPGITREDIMNSPSYQLLMPKDLLSTSLPPEPWYDLELWVSELFWSDDISKWKCLKYDKKRNKWYFDNKYELDDRPVIIKFQLSELDGRIISKGQEIIQEMEKVEPSPEIGLNATRKFPIRVPTNRRVKIDIWIILPCSVCCADYYGNIQHGKRRVIHREFEFNYDDFTDEPARQRFGIWVIERSVVHDYDDMGCIDDFNCPIPRDVVDLPTG